MINTCYYHPPPQEKVPAFTEHTFFWRGQKKKHIKQQQKVISITDEIDMKGEKPTSKQESLGQIVYYF